MPDEPSAPGTPATLFLSYARADQPRASELASALETRGYRVWWDALIAGGETYAQSIEDALERADAVLVLWSAQSVGSDWVRDEAAQGRDRHRLIPLSLDDNQPPLGFRQYQLIDLSHWNGRADSAEVDSVIRAVSSLTSGHAPQRIVHAPVRRRGVLKAAGASAVVIGAGGLAAWRSGLLGVPEARAETIAVLPFRNLSGDPGQAWFSDGLTDEIRAALARLEALQVLAAASSETARDHKDDAQAVSRKLGVAYLLEGSVRRSGDMVRVTAELTDGDTGFSRWATVFNRKLSDIFAVQSEIARTVANALSVQVATDRPPPGGTRNVDAYQAYLRGRALFNQARDEASDRAALANFELAITDDPRFAMAHAARSRCLSAIAGEWAKADELRALFDGAIESARKAVDLAPDMAEGSLALGYALFAGKLDVQRARPFYDRAYKLGRGDADVVLLYALFCSRTGRPEEARAAGDRAVALDPLNARTWRAQGSIAYAGRRYEDALAPLRHALQINPRMNFAHALMAAALLQLGKVKEAREECQKEPGDQFRLSGLAIVEQRLGNRAAAEAALRELETDVGDSALYQQAQVLAQWGRPAEALARLQRAKAVGDSGLIYLASDPLLDPLRREAAFQSFSKGLVQA